MSSWEELVTTQCNYNLIKKAKNKKIVGLLEVKMQLFVALNINKQIFYNLPWKLQNDYYNIFCICLFEPNLI
jgi:hypothetical protein